MFRGLQLRANEILSVAQSRFSLSSIHDFPEADFFAKRTEYEQLSRWYAGDFLLEKQSQGNLTVDKYPVKLNPTRGAVMKHAYALFGEAKSDAGPLAKPILKHFGENKEAAEEGQKFLARVWNENSGRTLMMRNAILSQVLGGCVFKLSYVPEQDWRNIPIRIEIVHPSNFYATPMSGDEYRLEQAWIVRPISAYEAATSYGVQVVDDNDENVYYVEYWSPDEYEITINGIPIPQTGKFDGEGNQLYYRGENPFGFVPLIYIPHIRASGFFGESLISINVQGIVEELNRREADWGDAVSDDSHRFYFLADTPTKPEVYELVPGVRVIQPNSVPAITGKEARPVMNELGGQSASEPMGKLVNDLYAQFRREAFIPGVADGEDEGSQRSGQTLAMRMWPLLSHTSTERIFWGDALNILDGMILKMTAIKSAVDQKLKGVIDPVILNMIIERRWAPILPRDREAFINELVQRATQKLGSLEHLIGMIDDIDDPTGELEIIKAELKENAKIQTDIAVERAKSMPQPEKPTTKQESKDVGPNSGK